MATNGVQKTIGVQPAPFVAGDYVSMNPHYSWNAGAGGVVAGPGGLTVGLFAWLSFTGVDSDGAPTYANNFGFNVPQGLVRRAQQGLNTTYLANASMFIPAGFPTSIMTAGDFAVVNDGATTAYPGMKAYASLTTGKVSFAATGSPTTASAATTSIAAGTAATFTGSIQGNILTTSGAVTNTIYPGAVLTGTGTVTGTTIVSQLTGTTGGAGTYALNVSELTVASSSLTATPYVMAAGTVTGTLVVGSAIISAGGTVTGQVVGASIFALNTPSAGNHIVGLPNSPGVAMGTVTSGTIVLASNVETPWVASSQGLAGELVKINNVPGVG
jgi:hypothetical protein